ncbi:MAG: hypothetical protein PUP93_28905 [Rhizonema sp. NSF051]|nr:hypothetical protein [Rhizonema sp. NSF051]
MTIIQIIGIRGDNRVKAKSWSWCLKIAILVFVSSASAVFSRYASAQIVPDATLGKERSQVTPTGVRDLITGGAVRDTTLFPSVRG